MDTSAELIYRLRQCKGVDRSRTLRHFFLRKRKEILENGPVKAGIHDDMIALRSLFNYGRWADRIEQSARFRKGKDRAGFDFVGSPLCDRFVKAAEDEAYLYGFPSYPQDDLSNRETFTEREMDALCQYAMFLGMALNVKEAKNAVRLRAYAVNHRHEDNTRYRMWKTEVYDRILPIIAEKVSLKDKHNPYEKEFDMVGVDGAKRYRKWFMLFHEELRDALDDGAFEMSEEEYGQLMRMQ